MITLPAGHPGNLAFFDLLVAVAGRNEARKAAAQKQSGNVAAPSVPPAAVESSSRRKGPSRTNRIVRAADAP